MADETTGGAEAQGADAPQAQGADDQPAAQAQGAADPAPEVMTVEALQRKNAELERDNRKYRVEARQREEAEKAAATAGMSEAERLKTENAALLERATVAERRAQEQSLKLATTGTATRLGFRNPDIAVGLIQSRVEFDEEGNPANVESLLTALAKSDPYLLTQTDFGGGQRGQSPAQAAPDMNAIIRGAASSRT